MIRVIVNQVFKTVFTLPNSIPTDTYVYTIYKVSDKSEFDSGNLTYFAGKGWEFTFTPTTLGEKYYLEAVDATGDVVVKEDFEAVGSVVENVAATTLDTSLAGMLTAVNTAIAANLAGGAVQSYSINGRNLQKATLKELYEIKRDLERRISAQAGNSRSYAKFVRP